MHIDVLYWDALLHHNFHEILLTISTWRRGNTHTCRVLWMEFLFLGIENRACFCFRGCCCVLCRNAYRTQPATIKKKNNNNTLFSESLLFGCKFDNVPHNFYVEKNISANTQQLCAVASTSFYWRWDVNSLVILHTHVISLVLALVFIFIMIILLVFFFSLSFNVFFHMFPQHARSFTIHKFCFFFCILGLLFISIYLHNGNNKCISHNKHSTLSIGCCVLDVAVFCCKRLHSLSVIFIEFWQFLFDVFTWHGSFFRSLYYLPQFLTLN